MGFLWLGLSAGALTTGAWLPQIYRIWRLGKADEISWGYLGAFGAGVTCWTIYGAVHSDPAIIAANTISLVLLIVLTMLKISSKRTVHSTVRMSPEDRSALRIRPELEDR